MELSQEQRQSQTLSPQMMQSVEILQMGSQELLDYLRETLQENPVLEADERTRVEESGSDLRRKLEWLESNDRQNYCYHQQDAEEDTLERLGGVDDGEEDLCRYVLSQVGTMELPGPLRQACTLLVESLDSNGWLDEELPALARELDLEEELAFRALELIQSLEPAGVGARDLAECLALQLRRRGEDDALSQAIVEHHLDDLAKNRLSHIARELGEEEEAVRRACEHIRKLNPRPGAGFAARERLTYITPDIIVASFPDHFELLTNDYFFPTLRLSGYYQQLMKESGDEQVEKYLSEKIRQAKWVIRSIEQRRTTLMDCAACILEEQEAFFRRGRGHLRPMTMADVARKLGIHESTVSRAVRDKYIQCSAGVYPLGYFFSRGLGGCTSGDGTAPEAAKALLRRLVEQEDKRAPLSDQKLCLRMAEEGCILSRRTVAKYRDELGLPSAALRKGRGESTAD